MDADTQEWMMAATCPVAPYPRHQRNPRLNKLAPLPRVLPLAIFVWRAPDKAPEQDDVNRG